MKVWSNETSGKIAIYFITIFIISMILFSGFAYYFADNTLLKQVSSGSLVLSISFIGLLKNAIELHENHKK